MSSNLEILKLVRGTDFVGSVFRKSEVEVGGKCKLVNIDCTGWTVSASIIYKKSLDIAVDIEFIDASIGEAELEISEENIALITPSKGCKLVIRWEDAGGRKRKTTTMVEVKSG